MNNSHLGRSVNLFTRTMGVYPNSPSDLSRCRLAPIDILDIFRDRTGWMRIEHVFIPYGWK